jgi:hypothetical protein
MGQKFATTIKELEATVQSGGVLKNSAGVSYKDANRVLVNIKKILTLQPNELVDASQDFFKVVTKEMGKKGVSLSKISVPFMKRAAIKEIRNITLAQLVAAEVKHDIIQKLYANELCWNDLLLSQCKLEDSVIEYIDPEEQNFANIAMKEKNKMLHLKYNILYGLSENENDLESYDEIEENINNLKEERDKIKLKIE